MASEIDKKFEKELKELLAIADKQIEEKNKKVSKSAKKKPLTDFDKAKKELKKKKKQASKPAKKEEPKPAPIAKVSKTAKLSEDEVYKRLDEYEDLFEKLSNFDYKIKKSDVIPKYLGGRPLEDYRMFAILSEDYLDLPDEDYKGSKLKIEGLDKKVNINKRLDFYKEKAKKSGKIRDEVIFKGINKFYKKMETIYEKAVSYDKELEKMLS